LKSTSEPRAVLLTRLVQKGFPKRLYILTFICLLLIALLFLGLVMDGSLPTSLKHIISNAEYYGPSLFLLGVVKLWILKYVNVFVAFLDYDFFSSSPVPSATEVVTVFVFQEPSLLSSLQDNGLTDVMLHALLIKDCQPFERLFKVLLSPDYLPAMRRRRSSDPLGECPDCAISHMVSLEDI
ncbi:E3 ubiquitin-protein ligase huwe1, partial [Xenoophorus captivus]